MDILLKAIDYLNTNNEYHVKADKKHGREEKHGEDAERVEKRRRIELHYKQPNKKTPHIHCHGCERSFSKNQALKIHIIGPGNKTNPGHNVMDNNEHPLRWRNGKKFIPDNWDYKYNKCTLCNHGFLEGWINRSKLERHYEKEHPGIDCPPPMQQNHNTLIRFV